MAARLYTLFIAVVAVYFDGTHTHSQTCIIQQRAEQKGEKLRFGLLDLVRSASQFQCDVSGAL